MARHTDIPDDDKSPTHRAVEDLTAQIGRIIGGQCPPGFGFALLMFDFGEGPDRRLCYVSNGTRADMVSTFKELIEKIEGDR